MRKADESVSAAVERLQPKLKSLLAARIVKQVLAKTARSLSPTRREMMR